MHRNNLLQLLDDYSARFPEEAAKVERLREFVLSNSHCFDRELAEGHLTGSAWLVDLSGSKVLLTHHKKLKFWIQLGGHADGCFDILAVSLSEAKEESGISAINVVSDKIFDIDIHTIPAYKNVPEHFHYDITFALQVADSEEYIVSEESFDLAWVDINEVEKYSTSESMLRLADKWQKLKSNDSAKEIVV